MKHTSPKQLLPHLRPREKLLESGPETLSTHELLQILIGSGTKKYNVSSVASRLEKYLMRSPERSLPSLLKIPGLGKVTVCRVMAAAELGRRLETISSRRYLLPQDLIPLVSEYLGRSKEHLILITINGAGELISKRLLTVGTQQSTLIHPREVFQPAIKDGAAGIFLIHNHPAGVLQPSEEDEQITQELLEVAKLIGIDFLDHLIVNKQEQYFSFREKGLLSVSTTNSG